MRETMDTSGIDCLGLDRVLERGTGEILFESSGALFIHDSVSGAFMLACEDTEAGMALLDRNGAESFDLLMVSDHALGKAAFERYGFSGKLECYQVAYYGEKPETNTELTVRTARMDDLTILTENYDLLSPEELRMLIERQSILMGYHDGELVGFIGEHLEGSMGILYVFPEFRRRGFGAALQTHMIAKTMENGYIPFGQVEKDNAASLKMQEKIGMTRSDKLIVWMWK